MAMHRFVAHTIRKYLRADAVEPVFKMPDRLIPAGCDFCQ
jgi:hypothetical protein